MPTFSIGFTSSQVFVMLSVATYIMLTAAGCNRTIGREIHNNLTSIVSYTLLLVNIAKLCTISHRRRNRGGTGGMCPPMFHKLSYKLLTTLCVVSDCAPQSKSLSYTSVSAYYALLEYTGNGINRMYIIIQGFLNSMSY